MTLLGQLLRGTLVGVGLVLQALVGLDVSGVELGPLDLNDDQLPLFPWIGLGFQLSAVALAVGAVARVQAAMVEEEDDETIGDVQRDDRRARGRVETEFPGRSEVPTRTETTGRTDRPGGAELAGGADVTSGMAGRTEMPGYGGLAGDDPHGEGYHTTRWHDYPPHRAHEESSEPATERPAGYPMESAYQGMEPYSGAQQSGSSHRGIDPTVADPASADPTRSDPTQDLHRPSEADPWSQRFPGPEHASFDDHTPYPQAYDYPRDEDRLSGPDHYLSTPGHLSPSDHSRRDPSSPRPDHYSAPDRYSASDRYPTPDRYPASDHSAAPEQRSEQWPPSPRGRRALPGQSGLPSQENQPRWPGDQSFQ
ncbi:hypothetical protein [Thermasporomyces composti]|jgi:hypothetical protein|uniref:Uncharacterized protein n=1 Tax=Thermasporomyces composti TaxID=696763 RepID=A0A3D9V500_THECX|nr:hypothetical protein [Thermasporomyces composti]REF36597.1 hypothetical protein DFJ64_2010 [Thermasporomyces composti]